MDKKKFYFIIVSLVLVIAGLIDLLIINRPRLVPTAEILGLPAWTYLPFLISEHLLGFIGISSILFHLCILGNLAYRFIARDPNFMKLSWINVITFTLAIFISLYYEFYVQGLSTYWEIPFDFIGIFLSNNKLYFHLYEL